MRKHEAIYKLYPNVVTIRGDVAYDKDEQEVTYDNNAVDALVASELYKEQRAKEYPAIADQLDYIYHNGIDAWKTDMIEPVKTKYPKGTV
jgi:alpha-glucosidase (family GH31 glycosyl hydrolase)